MAQAFKTNTSELLKLDESLSSDSLNILYFWADWAEPCKEMNTIFDQVASTYPTHETALQFFRINVDNEAFDHYVTKWNIEALPTILFVKNGTVLVNIEGFNPPLFSNKLKEFYSSPKSSADVLKKTENTMAASDMTLVNYVEGLDRALCEKLHGLIHRSLLMMFIKGTPSHPQCGFTRQLISLFQSQNIHKYGYFDILSDEDVRNGLKIYSDWPTFPQIYLNGTLIGGLDVLKELAHTGELSEMTSNLS